MNNYYLTNHGYVSNGTDRTSENGNQGEEGWYFYAFIDDVRNVLSGHEDICVSPFYDNEKVVLPLEFITGENLTYGN